MSLIHTRPDPNAEPLTDKQMAIFRFIYGMARDHGYQPSVREIGDNFGIASPNGVRSHMLLLAKKGWLGAQDPPQSRSLILLRNPDGSLFQGFVQKS